MIWTALPVALALAAEPFYAGGAPPQAINKSQHLRTSPSEFACSIDTMLKGQACVFDAEAPSKAAPVNVQAQSKENQKAAAQVGEQAKTTVDSLMSDVAHELGSVAEAVRQTSYEIGGESQTGSRYGERLAEQLEGMSNYFN